METYGSNPGPEYWREWPNLEINNNWFCTRPCHMFSSNSCLPDCEGYYNFLRARDRLSQDKNNVFTQMKCFPDAKDRLSNDKAIMTSHDKATMTTQGFTKCTRIEDSRQSPKREGRISRPCSAKRKTPEERKFQKGEGTSRKIYPEREGIRKTEKRRLDSPTDSEREWMRKNDIYYFPSRRKWKRRLEMARHRRESPEDWEREGTRKQSRNTPIPRRCEVRCSDDFPPRGYNRRLTHPNVYEQEQQKSLNDDDEQARRQNQIRSKTEREEMIRNLIEYDRQRPTQFNKNPHTSEGFAKCTRIEDSRKSPKREGGISPPWSPKRKTEERKFQNNEGTRKIDPEREGIRKTEMRRPESPEDWEREGSNFSCSSMCVCTRIEGFAKSGIEDSRKSPKREGGISLLFSPKRKTEERKFQKGEGISRKIDHKKAGKRKTEKRKLITVGREGIRKTENRRPESPILLIGEREGTRKTEIRRPESPEDWEREGTRKTEIRRTESPILINGEREGTRKTEIRRPESPKEREREGTRKQSRNTPIPRRCEVRCSDDFPPRGYNHRLTHPNVYEQEQQNDDDEQARKQNQIRPKTNREEMIRKADPEHQQRKFNKNPYTSEEFAKCTRIEDLRQSPKREGGISPPCSPKRKTPVERKFQNNEGTRMIDPEREGIRKTEKRRPESSKEKEIDRINKAEMRRSESLEYLEEEFLPERRLFGVCTLDPMKERQKRLKYCFPPRGYSRRLTDPNVYEQEQQNDDDEQARKQEQILEQEALMKCKAKLKQQQRKSKKNPHTSISLKQHNLLLDALSHRNKQIAYALTRKEDMLIMKNVVSAWYSVFLGTRRCCVRIGFDATTCMNLPTTYIRLKRREYRQVVNSEKDKDGKEDNDNEDKAKENVMKSDNDDKAHSYIPQVSTVPKFGRGWIIDLPSSRAGFETNADTEHFDSAPPPVFFFDICTEGSLRKRSHVASSDLVDLEKLKLLKFYTPTKQSLGLYPYNKDVPLASEHQCVGSIKITCEKMMCFKEKMSGIGEREEACQEAELRRLRELLKEQEAEMRELTDQAHQNETRLRDDRLELDKTRRQRIARSDIWWQKIEELELELGLDMRMEIERLQRENEREMECVKSAIDDVEKEQFLKFFDDRCGIRKELHASSPTCSDEDVNLNWRREATQDGTVRPRSCHHFVEEELSDGRDGDPRTTTSTAPVDAAMVIQRWWRRREIQKRRREHLRDKQFSYRRRPSARPKCLQDRLRGFDKKFIQDSKHIVRQNRAYNNTTVDATCRRRSLYDDFFEEELEVEILEPEVVEDVEVERYWKPLEKTQV